MKASELVGKTIRISWDDKHWYFYECVNSQADIIHVKDFEDTPGYSKLTLNDPDIKVVVVNIPNR